MRDRHRLDLFAVAAVLADVLRAQRRLVEQFLDPLAHGNRRWRQDQRRALQRRHNAHAHHRLAGAAGQDDDAAAAARAAGGMEDVDRLSLVVAQAKRVPPRLIASRPMGSGLPST